MEHAFQVDCQVTGTAEPTKFTGFISKDWSVGDAPNGGYLMALAINAARKAAPFRDPLSMTAYYLNKTIENAPVDIEVKILNETKSMVTASISLSQQGVLRSQYMGTLGTLSKQTGVNYNNLPLAPQLPHPDDCVDISAVIRDTYGEKMPFAHRIQYKAPKDDPFVIGAIDKKENKVASMSCWIRFDGGELLPGLRSMALFCDAMAPILGMMPYTWVPTLEYTVHFWQRSDFTKRGVFPRDNAPVAPATVFTSAEAESTAGTAAPAVAESVSSYWLRCTYNTPIVVNGLLYTDAQLWSEDGTVLLATSRQLAKVLTPR